MSQQLVKKGSDGRYSNVMPKSWIEAIKDKGTGQTLVEILQGFNMYFLPYNGNTSATRCLVPMILRKKGLWITYVKYDGNVYTEWYAASDIDDKSWGDSSNWRIGTNTLVGDITISANGNWVINGAETEFKAVGERGNTPLIRVANNRLQVSYDLGDTYRNVTENPVYTQFRNYNNKIQVSTDLGATWTDASDEIAAYFRWQATTGDSLANNVGRLQISRDKKTWTNLSNDIINNLHISKYIGANESLPTSGIAEGTIYAKGPTYAVEDTSNSNPIYRLWVYAWKGNTLAWQDNGEFTSIAAGIVQETGDNENAVMSQKATTEAIHEILYDVSANNAGAVFESISALLSSPNLSTLIPISARHGGMTIRFIQGSEQSPDNKYVQYHYMETATTADTFTNVVNWQGVDDEPTAGSDNLVKSGGVYDEVIQLLQEIGFNRTISLTTDDKVALNITGTVVSAPISQSWCGLVIPLQTGIKYDFGPNYDSSTEKGWQTIGICARYPQIGDSVTTLTLTQARSFIPVSGQKYALIHIRAQSLPYEYSCSSNGIKNDIADIEENINIINAELNKYGLTIGGVVKPTDSPTDTSGKQGYLCTDKGIYTNFNSNDIIPANGLYYWVLHTNNSWYKRVIVSHQKCKHDNISLIIREMFVIGAKPSDQLYIPAGGSSVENNDVKISLYKNNKEVSKYWHAGDAKFNEVVEFTEVNNSGIKIYAIFDEYTVTQTSGLPYSNSGLTDECYSLDTNGEIAAYLYKDNAARIEEIKPKDGTVKWTTNTDINACIAEMYIPNALSLFDDGLYVSRCVVSEWSIRFDLRGFTSDTLIVTCTVDLHKYYFNTQSDGSYKTYFGQGAITPIYKTIDGVLQRIGYIKFNLHNFATSGTRVQVDLNAITNIDNSPSIKKMLSDDRQIILLGDSHFGYPTPNILADVIQGITGIKTFNLGFGGCRMAWRSVDGSNEWDSYSFTNIADALVSQDFTLQRANVGIGFGYSRQVADLEAIDITKPMQIVLEYGNNDSNNFVDPTPIGDMWQDDSSFDITIPDNVTTKLESLSRNTFLGAFNYGLLKLYNAFPITLNLQVLSQMWRFLNNADGQRVSVLNYRNGLNLSVGDYNKALQNNCIQLGIRYNDFFNAGIMNYFSLRPVSNQDDNIGVGIRGSAHLEEIGFAMLAQYLVDKIKNFYSI